MDSWTDFYQQFRKSLFLENEVLAFKNNAYEKS